MENHVHDRWTKAAFAIAVGFAVAMVGASLIWLDKTIHYRGDLGVVGVLVIIAAVSITWSVVGELKPWA